MRTAFALVLCLASAAALRAQAAPDPTPAEPVLHVRAGDLVRVRVWPDTILGGDFPVEEDGHVVLPVVGGVQVAGRSLAQLRQELRGRYEQAMKMPVVNVTTLYRIPVLGSVEHPGVYPADPTSSLFDLIGLAGGLREDARSQETRIIRDGRVISVDLRQALRTGELPAGLDLQSGDRIVVPRRAGGLNLLLSLQVLTFLATMYTILRR